MPSKPRDSILTLSPTSKDLDLIDTSDCRLGGRLVGRVNVGVLARSGTFADEVDAADDGLPATERRPFDRGFERDRGDKDEEEEEELAERGNARC